MIGNRNGYASGRQGKKGRKLDTSDILRMDSCSGAPSSPTFLAKATAQRLFGRRAERNDRSKERKQDAGRSGILSRHTLIGKGIWSNPSLACLHVKVELVQVGSRCSQC